MTQKVLTFNLILSTSKSMVDAALATGSAKELTRDSRFKNVNNFKFFTLNNNKSLLQFEYQFSKEQGTVFTLQFLDYDGFFEYNLISSNINDFIVGYVSKEDIRNANDQNVNPFNNFYIAFGTTDNLEEWSGPHSVFLQRSNYEFTDEGVKKVDLFFYTDEGPSRSILAKIQRTENQYKSKITSTPLNHMIESKYSMGKSVDKFESDFFDGLVFDELIKNYLKAYTGLKEAVVLIPDMKNYKSYYDSLKSSRSKSRGAASTSYSSNLDQIEAFTTLASDFGLIFEPVIAKEGDQVSVVTVQEKNNEEADKKISDCDYLLKMMVTTPESNEAKGGNYLEFADGYVPLHKIAEGLHKLTNPKNVNQYTLVTESDSKILSVWKESGLINNDTEPVAVWGRLDYITNSLYPKFWEKDIESDLTPTIKNKLDGSYVYEIGEVFSKSYNSDFKEEVGSTISEFSLGKFKGKMEINENTIAKLKIPLFKSNIKNPNVTFYSFINFKDNIPALQCIVDNFKGYAIQDSAAFVINEYDNLNLNFKYNKKTVAEFIDSKSSSMFNRNSIKKLQNVLPPKLLKRPPEPGVGEVSRLAAPIAGLGSNPFKEIVLPDRIFFDNINNTLKVVSENYKEFIQFLMSKKLLNTSDEDARRYATLFISNNFENKTELQQKINMMLSNFVVNLTVRTLPFFNITGTKYIAYPCIFLQKLFQGWVSPLCGFYSILGIKHIVNPNEMYSEFELVKEGFGNSQPVKLNSYSTDQTPKPKIILDTQSGIGV